ncbi:hypothetical protein N7520_009046 [Penicillium odoratum]|uniref:uncharacterized protein n=1 Tax=Penicillium odoratum TaxID=1167516 RepID=UPI002547067A|nr:uncharacterized protein N7520_009046 [Penicillium odoratum]KAJ5752129.1 hypothetical protein N7520_009046 [Penicillium odoratum]
MAVEDESGSKGFEPHSSQLIDADGTVLLVPIPTTDPADPLNWPNWQRWIVLACLAVWAATCLAVQSFLSNILPGVETDFANASASQINLLVTIITAICAPSSLIFVPLVVTYGRRFALLVSNIILFASVIWAAVATSYSSFLGSRILQAVGTAPSDAIVYIILQDITFTHERGKIMGIVLNVGYAVFYLLSTVVPYMSTSPSYKGPYWLFTGLTALCMLGFFFFLPEVRFDRSVHAENDTHVPITAAQHQELKKRLASQNKSSLSGLTFWSGRSNGPEGDFFLIYKRMARLLRNPAIWWNGLMNAIITGGMVAYTTYFANLLFAPPWSWKSENIGLINLAGVPVAAVNWVLFGWLNDRILIALAKRNNGLSVPEHRLIMLVVPVAIAFAAYIGFGALAQHYFGAASGAWQPNWFVLVVLQFLILMAFSGTLEVTYTYMISTTDPTDSLAAATVVSILRGDVSFGMSHGSTAFVMRCGYLTTFSVYAMLTAVFGAMGVVEKLFLASHIAYGKVLDN